VLESLQLDGPRNQKDIARELDLSESGLSRLLVKLEASGYVRREQGVRKEMIIHPG
jgi:DNA-binding MarR family transcriptional regulator